MGLRPLSVLILLVTASCGPVPGGSLGGEVAPIPSDWSTVIDGGRSFCEIESRPRSPEG